MTSKLVYVRRIVEIEHPIFRFLPCALSPRVRFENTGDTIGNLFGSRTCGRIFARSSAFLEIELRFRISYVYTNYACERNARRTLILLTWVRDKKSNDQILLQIKYSINENDADLNIT